MRTTTRAGLELLAFDTLGDGVEAVVTTRHGGTSTGPYAGLNLGDHVGDDPAAVRANRDLVAEALGVAALTIPDQCHGARVAVVDDDLAGAGHTGGTDAAARLGATDGLVTDRPGIALTILVGDCVPVVVWDPARRALGVAHAGRLGTVLGVVPAVITTLGERYGSRPGDLRIGIGPHIGATSYEVGPAEVAEAEAAFPGLGVCTPTAGGRATLDLEGAVRAQLADAGVASDAVERAGIDTLRSTDRFFSHRAERPCGRFALVATIVA